MEPNMVLSTRRQFVQQAAFAAAALCGCPIEALAKASRVFDAREQNAAPFDAMTIRRFASQITGHVVTPETPDYDSARLIFNRAFDRRPAVNVRCAGLSDVACTLDFAQKHNMPLAVRGGGHSRV